MNKILKRKTFYVELSPDEIKIATKKTVSIYPIWLGKNRAVIRDVSACFNKTKPQSLYECMHIIGHYGMSGQGSDEVPNKNNFILGEDILDKHNNFW